MFGKDKSEFIELPAYEFDVCKYETIKTNKYGKFFLNKGLHEYSVSPKYASTKVQLKLTASHVIVLNKDMDEIISHQRLYGDYKQQSMQWIPYFKTLSKRPGAIKYTGIYNMFPDPLKKYFDLIQKTEKGRLLKIIAKLSEKDGFDNAVKTIEKALEYNVLDHDSLMNLHNRIHDKIIKIESMQVPNHLPKLEKYVPNFNYYDKHLRKEVKTNV